MPVLDPSSPLAYGVDPKLATALTDPTRAHILEELQSRPLSPSQFVRERGGDLNHVARSFRYLKTCGYAEVVEERSRAARGSSVEHVYGLSERGGLSASLREPLPEISIDPRIASALGSYWSRIVEAVTAGTLEGRVETHTSWDTLVLDREARSWLRERLNRLIAEMSEHSGDEGQPEALARTTLGFTILRSPQPPEEILRRFRKLPQETETPFRLNPEVANALANRWRAKILTELFSRPMSPSQFVERFGGDPSYVARCFRELSKWGLIELIEEKGGGRNGGGVERIFRNAQHCYFDQRVWPTVPRFLRIAVSRGWASVLGERLDEAVGSGAVREAHDLCAGCRQASVTFGAWRKLNQELDWILDRLPQLQAESMDRSDGDLTTLEPILVSMACFESPPR